MTTVTVEIPKELLDLAGLEGEPTSPGASRLLALELFREGRVSLGRAAELADLSIEAFMEFSAQREVALHYSGDDLAQDRDTATRLKL